MRITQVQQPYPNPSTKVLGFKPSLTHQILRTNQKLDLMQLKKSLVKNTASSYSIQTRVE